MKTVFAFVFGQAFGVNAAIIDGRVDFQVVFLAGDEVVRAVAGSGVHDAATLIEGNVIGEDAGNFDGQEWVLKFQAFELTAFKGGKHIGLLDFAIGLQRGDAIGGEQQLPFFGLHDYIFEVGMEGQCSVVRNGPTAWWVQITAETSASSFARLRSRRRQIEM